MLNFERHTIRQYSSLSVRWIAAASMLDLRKALLSEKVNGNTMIIWVAGWARTKKRAERHSIGLNRMGGEH